MQVARNAAMTKGTMVATMVDMTAMPGTGTFDVKVSAPIGKGKVWNSLADAERAVRALTDGDENPSAGIFKQGGKFTAYSMDYGQGGYDDPLYAFSDSVLCRTKAGRSLVKIVDGNVEPDLTNYKNFAYYKRQANAGA